MANSLVLPSGWESDRRSEGRAQPGRIAAKFQPQAPLSDFIDCIWYWDGYVQPHSRERLLPDGSISLVFDLSRDSGDTAEDVLTGARTTSFVLETSKMFATLGVHFKPGGAFPFLRFPAHELSEQSVPLDAVFGSAVRGLRDRILEPSTPRQKFRIVEQWLTGLAGRSLQRHPAVEFALHHFESCTTPNIVSKVTERLGFSHRYFIEKFNSEVGLTPKRYSRVRRFQRVLAAVGVRHEVDWADLALDCGYYDQSHFVRDFKTFSSLTPEEYLRSCNPHRNHVPLAS